MDRLTRVLDNKNFFVDESKINRVNNGYFGDAVNKLAMFENFYDDLVANQLKISNELEKLRTDGKTHTVKFKQLFAKKLENKNILILFKTYGL